MTTIERQLGCNNCGAPLDCVDTNPLDLYSLEGPRFGFVLNCPPGENCSNATRFTLLCCGQFITAQFPPGATASQRQQIIADAVQRCATANLFCGENLPEIPPPGQPPPVINLYQSRAQVRNVQCTGGGAFNYTVVAGTFVANTQAEADQLAIDFANNNASEAQFCVVVPGLCPCVGLDADFAAKIIGGIPSYFAQPTSGHFPVGMTVSTSGRSILFRGIAQTPGLYQFTLNVRDRTGSYWTGVVTLAALLIGYSTITTGGFTVPAVSATDTVTVVDASNLTVGDTVTLAIFTVGFVSTEVGTFEVMNIASNTVTLKNLTATAGVIVPVGSGMDWALDSLPNYTQNTPYSFQLPATGGSGNYSWKISSGSLPTGLTLSLTGLISGTPTGTGSFNFTASVSDNSCETADKSFFPPIVRLTGSSVRTVATVRGFDEFGTPSFPPRRFMTRTWSGLMTGNDASGEPVVSNEALSVRLYAEPDIELATAHVVFSGSDQIDLQGNQTSTAMTAMYSSCNNATPSLKVIDFQMPASTGRPMPGWCYQYDLHESFGDLPSPTYPTCISCNFPLVVDNTIGDKTNLYQGGPLILTATTKSNTSSGDNALGIFPNPTFLTLPPNLGVPALNGKVARMAYKHAYSIDLTNEYTDAIALANARVINSNSLTAVNRPRTTGYVSEFVTVNYSLSCSNLVVGESYTVTVNLVTDTNVTTTVTTVFTATGISHVVTGTIPTPSAGHTITARNPSISFSP